MHQHEVLHVPDGATSDGAASERPAPHSRELPPVSVLVAVYNHAPFIRECLDSIVAAEYPVLELIIINDASPDGSDEVIRAWLSQHPDLDASYVPHEENRGITKSLNEAVQRAKYPLLCMFAGDDVMLRGSITERVRYLESHPDKLAVFADSHVIDETGRRIFESGIEDFRPEIGMRKRNLRHDDLLLCSVVFNFMVPGPVFMCKRELFEVVGFYDEELLVEDWDMYIRAALAGKLGFLDRFVADYRVHSASMMRQNKRSNRLLPSLLKTIEKNLPRASGLIKLRLIALRAAIAYDALRKDSAANPFAKATLWLNHKLLLATTNWAYLAKRWFVGA